MASNKKIFNSNLKAFELNFSETYYCYALEYAVFHLSVGNSPGTKKFEGN